MTSIRDFTMEELERELARRELPIPQMLPAPDYEAFKEYMESNVMYIYEHGYAPKDMWHYIGEEAFIMLYGKGFFSWYNTITDR